MKTTASNFADFLRIYFGIGAAICALAIYQTQVQTEALLKLRTRYKWAILMLIFALNAVVGLYLAFSTSNQSDLRRRFVPRSIAGPAVRVAALVVLLLPVPVFLYARLDFFGRGLEAFFRLLWLFWWLALLQAASLRVLTGLGWFRSLALVLLIDGVAAELYTLANAVSDYPFSMGWSEASRYYYGSLVWSQLVYGEPVPLSVMHGTRYMLQSLPFLLRGSPLVVSRLWQVALWVGLTGWSSWALVRRLGVRAPLSVVVATAWLFLYYFQGAVYYHLQVPVIIVLLGTARGKPWASLAAVCAASFWAGMSRVNWFPVPAMIAIGLYMLETPIGPRGRAWAYLGSPIVWGLAGLACAFVGQTAYIAMSGNTNLEAFASSFTSALLWYRWLPSATNPIGIIPGTALISVVPVAAGVWLLRSRPRALHPLRLAALALMLVVLLAGGLLVSAKIGGGGDLHNMDAYMVMLAILGAYAMWGSPAVETRARWPKERPAGLTILLVLVPLAFSLARISSPFNFDRTRAEQELGTLRDVVREYSPSGEVLFMYERHLLTFGMVPRATLVPEYEVVTLMEMAISGNESYLSQYYRDLESHRFSAIVAHPQNLGVESGDFIEENDAWARYVGQPLLCQYKPALTLEYSKVQILVPRARPCLEYPPTFGGGG